MKDVVGGAGGGTEPHRLHTQVDAELDRIDASEGSADMAEPEIEEYETRLRSLHDAVVEMEVYERALDEI